MGGCRVFRARSLIWFFPGSVLPTLCISLSLCPSLSPSLSLIQYNSRLPYAYRSILVHLGRPGAKVTTPVCTRINIPSLAFCSPAVRSAHLAYSQLTFTSTRPCLVTCARALVAVRDPVRVFNGKLESTSGGGVVSHGRESVGDKLYLFLAVAPPLQLVEVSVLISPLFYLAAISIPLHTRRFTSSRVVCDKSHPPPIVRIPTPCMQSFETL